MRYQIADGIIDDVQRCWLAFLLAPLGAGDTLAWAAYRAAHQKEVKRCGIV